ncbi:uncharacterized protein LOC110716494 [Chenopodium quinoa]|uniref:uncharacterized protein LOC110716494 n=1 Tax=Chenopodium quinoa TaxID=63459 RepID=UPI000B791D84|nr:uncharacterized protein LOC110716494 [Chenopodium quinoa]
MLFHDLTDGQNIAGSNICMRSVPLRVQVRLVKVASCTVTVGFQPNWRMSKTLRNPYRLFFNCPKNVFQHQCEFFHWSDELSASVERSRKEISFLRNECIRLHKRIAYVQSRRENDRALWELERSELRSEVSSVQAELDDIKSRVQHLYKLDNMPPVDESYVMKAENDEQYI